MKVNKVRQWVKEFGAVNFGQFRVSGDVFNVVVKPCKGLYGVYYVHGRLYDCGAFVHFEQQGFATFNTEKEAAAAVVKLYNIN